MWEEKIENFQNTEPTARVTGSARANNAMSAIGLYMRGAN